jgi:hypothetical protein
MLRSFACSSVVILFALFLACDPVKPEGGSDAATCSSAECTAACQAQGRSGGYCGTAGCVCSGLDQDSGLPGVTVTGKVWSPGKVVPISGALVWFASAEPAPIPDHAYPETCATPNGPNVLSRPDGTFTLQVSPGDYHLVVQKGQFRRVRTITVPAQGPFAVDEVLTTLPSSTSQGDTIPRIALLWALDGGDHIEDVLAKIGMGNVVNNRLDVGTEQFDIYNIAPYPDNNALLTDVEVMKSYHMIFFPCTIDQYPQLNDPTGPLENPVVLQNLRDYLTAGGKIYATDMMYDIFEKPLPDYVDMCGDDAVLNDGDYTAWEDSRTSSGWTSNGEAVDDDLAAWLDAIGVGSTGLQFNENFVWIESLYLEPEPTPGPPDAPKVWVQGDFILNPSRTLPLTITFPYNAGKVLFSTYHTVGDGMGSVGHAGIYPQEYVLLYLIMEIGVCSPPVE